jgi:hypothetical protein
LDDLGILAVQTAFLVLFHPGDLFFQAKKKGLPHNLGVGRMNAYRFLARLSLSASPVGARESAKVASSSIACRPLT